MENIRGQFCEAIKCGREIEFIYKDKHYFESRHSDTDWYIYCEETNEEQHFASYDKLIVDAKLDGNNINNIWDDIIIEYIL